MQSTLPLDPPANLSRREVIALANETGRAFGLSAAALQVLARLIGSTESRDWKDPEAVRSTSGSRRTSPTGSGYRRGRSGRTRRTSPGSATLIRPRSATATAPPPGGGGSRSVP